MKVIDPGHIYELNEVGNVGVQTIRFIKSSGEHKIHAEEWPGLYNQEVLRALIDRTKYLNDILPREEYVEIINHLRSALYLFEARVFQRDNPNTEVPFSAESIENMEVGEDGFIKVDKIKINEKQ